MLRKSKTVSDTGRSLGRARDEHGSYEIPSLVLPWYATKGNPLESSDDVIIEYEGKKYFVGGICEFVEQGQSGQALLKEKDTLENLLINLVMLSKLKAIRTDLLMNIPFTHLQEDGEAGAKFKEEKVRIKKMFEKTHEIQIYYGNGRNHPPITESHTITIDRLGFAGETQVIFYLDPTKEHDVGIIEVGSRTVQGVYYRKGRIHYGRSFALNWGWDTVNNKSAQSVSELLMREMAAYNWTHDLQVRVAGGVADKLQPELEKTYYRSVLVPSPRYANLNAMWSIFNR